MAGPKPTPTNLKLLKGNPGHQKMPKNEPSPRPLAPAKPDFGRNERASLHWDELVPVLEYMGCLTEADGSNLRLLCLELSTVDLCEAQLQKLDDDDYVYKTSNGSQAPSAWLKQRREAAKAAEGLMARFGLSPADRTKIEVNKPSATDEDPTEKAIAAARRS
jgi:P27 family predicted phage terminase small subunit